MIQVITDITFIEAKRINRKPQYGLGRNQPNPIHIIQSNSILLRNIINIIQYNLIQFNLIQF